MKKILFGLFVALLGAPTWAANTCNVPYTQRIIPRGLVPICANGEVLTGTATGMTCVDAAGISQLTLPTCNVGEYLTWDGSAFHCATDIAGTSAGSGLPADPAACPGGRFVTDLDINGSLTCAQPQWADVAAKPTSFTPIAHTHPGSDVVSAVPSADAAPWSGITGKPSTFSPASHTHAGAEVTSAVANANAAPWAGITGKPTTYPPSTHAHGVSDLTTTGTPSSSTYLRGDGQWATPAGGGGGAPTTGTYVTMSAEAGLSAETVVPTCTGTQALTRTGAGLVCTDVATGLAGVTSDGSNGLIIEGSVQSGAGTPTVINVTTLTVAQLAALVGNVTGDHRMVSDGSTAADCTTGLGTTVHWCYYNGSAWVAENSVGPQGPAGPAGSAGATGPTGPQGPQGQSAIPGATSDGSNGMILTGKLAWGGTPTVIKITTLTVSALQALTGNATGDHRMVSDGTTAADCTSGGGSNTHWCYYSGSAWVAENSVGPAGPAGPTGPQGATGSTGATGATGPAPTPTNVSVSYAAGSTTTVALASSPWAGASFTATHGTSSTLAITNPVQWGSYVVVIKQDSTGGGVTLTLGSGCTWKLGGSGAGAVTLSTAANAIDVLAFTYDGTNCLANFRTNFN